MNWTTYFNGVANVTLCKLCDAAKSIPIVGKQMAAPLDALSTAMYFKTMFNRPRDNAPAPDKKGKKPYEGK